MKRDMELMRFILQAAENDLQPWQSADVKKYPREIVLAHAVDLIAEQYVEGQIYYTARRTGNKEAESYNIARLTDKGREFLAAGGKFAEGIPE